MKKDFTKEELVKVLEEVTHNMFSLHHHFYRRYETGEMTYEEFNLVSAFLGIMLKGRNAQKYVKAVYSEFDTELSQLDEIADEYMDEYSGSLNRVCDCGECKVEDSVLCEDCADA